MVEEASVNISFYCFQWGSTFSPFHHKPGTIRSFFKNDAIFSKFAMVPRPLAPARTMRSRTCADVFQPFQFKRAKKVAKAQGAWERDNWETACTDDRHLMLVYYAGVLAIPTGSKG